MVAFEPCLATVGVAGDGSGNTTIYIPYHTYTIPVPYRVVYHTELPTLSQISGASASAIDRRFEQGDSRISLLLWRAGQRCER